MSHKHGLAAQTVSKWRPPRSIFQDEFLHDSGRFRGQNFGEKLNVNSLWTETENLGFLEWPSPVMVCFDLTGLLLVLFLLARFEPTVRKRAAG